MQTPPTPADRAGQVFMTIEKEAMFLREGDRLLTDTDRPASESAFAFAVLRDANLRRSFDVAGRPPQLLVASNATRVPGEPSDVEVFLRVGDELRALSFHRECIVRVEAEAAPDRAAHL